MAYDGNEYIWLGSCKVGDWIILTVVKVDWRTGLNISHVQGKS